MKRALWPIACLLSLWATPVLAADATAEQLYQEGRAAADGRDWPTACAKFRESQAREPAPGTLLNLGNCEEQLGKLLDARAHFLEASRLFSAGDKRIDYADQRAREIETKLAKLTVRVAPGSPKGIQIEDNGAPWPTLDAPVPVEPGAHTLRVSAEGYVSREHSLQLAPGEVNEVELAVGAPRSDATSAASVSPAPRAVAPAPPETAHGWSAARIAGFAGLGVGALALGVGIVGGVQPLDAKHTVDAECTSLGCNQTGLDAQSRGKTWSPISTVGFVIAGVALATGTGLLVWSATRKPASVTARVQPTGLLLSGDFERPRLRQKNRPARDSSPLVASAQVKPMYRQDTIKTCDASQRLLSPFMLHVALCATGLVGCAAILGADFDHPPLPVGEDAASSSSSGGSSEDAALSDGASCDADPCEEPCDDGLVRTTNGCELDRMPTISIAAYDDQVCGLRSDGSVICWGKDAAEHPGPFKQIAVGRGHVCAARADGQVECWLLDDSVAAADDQGQATPPRGRFRQIAAANDTTCGVNELDRLECWGLGFSTPPPPDEVHSLSLSRVSGCALTPTGAILCWGDGKKSIPAGDEFSHVATGITVSCAISEGTKRTCWADEGTITPPLDSSERGYQAIVVGRAYACTLDRDDVVGCWNPRGSTPAAPQTDRHFRQIAAGESFFCGIQSDDSVLCWGGLVEHPSPPGPFL